MTVGELYDVEFKLGHGETGVTCHLGECRRWCHRGWQLELRVSRGVVILMIMYL
jgi:hypothetical protein